MTQSIWLKLLIYNKFSPKQTKGDNLYKLQTQIHSGLVFCLLSLFKHVSLCFLSIQLSGICVKKHDPCATTSPLQGKLFFLFQLFTFHLLSHWLEKKLSKYLCIWVTSPGRSPSMSKMSKAGLIRTWCPQLWVRILCVQQYVLPQLQEHHWGSTSS